MMELTKEVLNNNKLVFFSGLASKLVQDDEKPHMVAESVFSDCGTSRVDMQCCYISCVSSRTDDRAEKMVCPIGEDAANDTTLFARTCLDAVGSLYGHRARTTLTDCWYASDLYLSFSSFSSFL